MAVVLKGKLLTSADPQTTRGLACYSSSSGPEADSVKLGVLLFLPIRVQEKCPNLASAINAFG
jgi:hypothetical protein